MKKTLLAWLMILAVLLSFAGCGSEQEENFAGGDTEIHEAEKLPEETPGTEPDDSENQQPGETDTPVNDPVEGEPTDEEPKEEEIPSDEEQKPSEEENKEEQTPSEEEQTPSTEEDKPADQLPGTAVSFYATYQKVHQLQSPDRLEAYALTYVRNGRSIFRMSGMEELSAFENAADPYFQFTATMEQGDQDGSISDELLGDDAPIEDEDESEMEEPAIGFMEGLTGNVYSDSFFQQNSILMIYNVAPGRINNGNITTIRKDGNVLKIYLDVAPQTSQTNDNIYRFITLEFKKADIADCEIFQIIEVDNSKK